MMSVLGIIPNSYELDINIDREGPLECGALAPARLIVARVHFICEWDLLVIALWQEPDLEESDLWTKSDDRYASPDLVDPAVRS